MSQWKNLGAIVALSITAALAGTGCLAESADDDAMNEPAAAVVDQDNADASIADETGEAREACCGGFGWGDIASLGFIVPGLGFGGFGPFFHHFGGCGLGLGGCGGCGLGLGGCGGCW